MTRLCVSIEFRSISEEHGQSCANIPFWLKRARVDPTSVYGPKITQKVRSGSERGRSENDRRKEEALNIKKHKGEREPRNKAETVRLFPERHRSTCHRYLPLYPVAFEIITRFA